MVPSSIETGTETTTAFLHWRSTLMRFWSMPNERATRCSCCCAIANGFSRRWLSGSSTVVTAESPSSTDVVAIITPAHGAKTRLSDPEDDAPAGWRAAPGGVGEELQLVPPGM